MSAAAELDAMPRVLLVPPGVPVRSGRVHVGRLRGRLPSSGPVVVVAGFGTACWLGGAEQEPPGLGAMVFRGEATLDGRGRVVLGRQALSWLAVADPAAFDAVVMPAPVSGLLVIPTDRFAERAAAVTP